MRAVFGLVLVAGVGLAGTAAYMVRNHFESQAAQLASVEAERVPFVYVFAVNRQVVYGEQLRPEDFVAVKAVEESLPEGTFSTQEELFPEGPDALRTVLRQMEPNEPVLAAKVTEPGEDAGITSRLAQGMRAFAISVDVASGVSGFLRPGDRVDVYWSGNVSEMDASREVTQLIESGLRLVAIDQTADDNLAAGSIARTVTVEVTPQQVAALAQAQSTGSLSLSLVGQGDDTVAEAIEVDQRSLLGLEDAPAPVVEAAAPAPETCVRVERRGTERVEIPTPCLGN